MSKTSNAFEVVDWTNRMPNVLNTQVTEHGKGWRHSLHGASAMMESQSEEIDESLQCHKETGAVMEFSTDLSGDRQARTLIPTRIGKEGTARCNTRSSVIGQCV